MKCKYTTSLLILILLSGCSSQSPNYDKLGFAEFSSMVFKNENYLAMQQPCKTHDLRQDNVRAVACYESVARANPGSPEAHYLLAIAYLYAGDAVKTKQQALIIEKLSPGFLRLTFHAVAHTDRAFIRAFKFEPRWLSRS